VPEFKPWRSYCGFDSATKRHARHVRGADTEGFLATVLSTAEKRVEAIPPERFLWRARLGHAWEPLHQEGQYADDVPAPFPPERMKPLPDRAVSAPGPGHNVALYDLGAAQIVNCFVWEVKSVSFDFAEAANPSLSRPGMVVRPNNPLGRTGLSFAVLASVGALAAQRERLDRIAITAYAGTRETRS